MRILLTGRTGQVGWELERSLAALGEVIALDRAALDLADGDAIRRVVREARPEVIVNAAAYTSVDKAETEQERAFAINAVAPGLLADEAARFGALVIHFSTDYVFDGLKPEPYTEDDPPRPLCAYGRGKLEGERRVAMAGGPYLILRTSWVYSYRGTNFLHKLRERLGRGDPPRVVDDQIGAPTYAVDLADTLARVLGTSGESIRSARRTYNVCGSGETSWWGFARAIQELDQEHLPDGPAILPVSSSDYQSGARRPANSRLSMARLEREFGVRIPDWRDGLRRCLARLHAGYSGS